MKSHTRWDTVRRTLIEFTPIFAVISFALSGLYGNLAGDVTDGEFTIICILSIMLMVMIWISRDIAFALACPIHIASIEVVEVDDAHGAVSDDLDAPAAPDPAQAS